MEEKEILEVFRGCHALLQGHFQLSSGLHSTGYLQSALVLQHPKHAEKLCGLLAEPWAHAGITAVVGPALGGIVLAYELARSLDCRGLFMERQGGKMALRRGFSLARGERVLIAEDVITTGGSVAEIAEVLRAIGAEIAGVACLVDRGGGERFADMHFHSLLKIDIPTFAPDECEMCREGRPLEKPGSRPEKR